MLNGFFKLVFLPPGLTLLLALVGLAVVAFRRRTGFTLLAIGVLGSYLSSLPITAALLAGPAQSDPPLAEADLAATPAEWIVILGGGTDVQRPDWGGTTVNSWTLDRLRYGARLARITRLPVLVSGGAARGGEAEATLMKNLLRDEFGIQRVVAEDSSRTTHENAVQAAQALRANNATRVLLVTHAVHMKRAASAFRRAGVTVVRAPTAYYNSELELTRLASWLPEIRAQEAVRMVLHEWVGWWWYRWHGWVVP